MSLLAKAGGKPLRPQVVGRIFATVARVKGGHDVVTKRGIKSLAFTTYFCQPELGMTEYEMLARGSASLLAVDPPDTTAAEGPYGHLDVAEERRKIRDFKKLHGFTPATGEGNVSDMGWLQFMPREHRPNVHVVTSSHVVSPFLWLDYYPHDWLTKVQQDHCKYTIEVYDSEKPGEVLGTYDLYNTPIHHPEGRDICLLHIQEEETALQEMKKFGVEPLYIRDPDKLYSKGETIYFDGFIVHDPDGGEASEEQDTRIFEPYEEIGHLSSHTHDRFFADTATPLPEGLCGAPALDTDGDLCGIVEGIVPIDHENKKMAGCAAFLPSFILEAFQGYAERWMLEQMMPKDMFQNVVRARETNTIGGGSVRLEGDPTKGGVDAKYEEQVAELKKKYSKEEVDAILWNIKRERKEVEHIMTTEGGDLDEVIARVRAKTLATREAVMQAYKRGEFKEGGEGEVDSEGRGDGKAQS